MELIYERERNEDFLSVCENIRRNAVGYMSVSHIARLAAASQAKSYYLCHRQMSKIVKSDINSLKNNLKRELYETIKARFSELKELYPEASKNELYKILTEEPAQRFYISSSRAATLYYRLLKKRFR